MWVDLWVARAAFATQRSVIDLDTRLLSATVQMIRAVGGGWSSTALEQAPES